MQTFAPFAARVSAAARALASRGTNPLINDPFAEPSVRAVGLHILPRLAGGEVDPVDMFGMARMADMVGCRRCGGGRGDAHIQLADARKRYSVLQVASVLIRDGFVSLRP